MRYITIDNQPCERKPHDYPYSYTRFCEWKGKWSKTDQVIWSDRIDEQYEGARKLFRDLTGKPYNFSLVSPFEIERWLSRLFGKEIMLTGIERECNACTGYPYWLLYFRENDFKN